MGREHHAVEVFPVLRMIIDIHTDSSTLTPVHRTWRYVHDATVAILMLIIKSSVTYAYISVIVKSFLTDETIHIYEPRPIVVAVDSSFTVLQNCF